MITRSEFVALRAYALTGSQKLAADQIGISYQTLKNQLANAYEKLNVNDAISAYVKLGWLSVPDVTIVTLDLTVTRRDNPRERLSLAASERV